MSLEETLRMLSQATQSQGQRVQQAQAQPVNRRLINPGQRARDVITNPTDNQSRALLEMSMQMLQQAPGELPVASMGRGISKGMALLDQFREGDRTRDVETAKTGYGLARDKQDSTVEMAKMLQPAKPPSSIAEYQYAVDQGYKGRYDEFLKAKRGGVNVNLPGQPAIGTIPPGHSARQDAEGNWSMSRIPGSPAEAEAAAAAAQETARTTGKATIAGYTLRDARVIQERIPQMAENGAVRWARSRVPGTAEFEVEADIKSLQGTIGIEQLLRIKESGAGLGQVPQTQLNLLSRLMGELDIRRDPEVLSGLIGDIQETYMEILNGMGEKERNMVGIAEREYDALRGLWGAEDDTGALIKKYTGGN